MKKIRLVFLINFVLLSTTVFPLGRSVSFAELVSMMKSRNLKMQIAELDFLITRENYYDLKAFPNPEFEFGKGRAGFLEKAGKRSVREMGVRFKIPNLIKRYHELRGASAAVDEGELKFLMAGLSVEREFKNHLFRLLYLQEVRRIADSGLKVLRELVKLNRLRVELGESRKTDLLRAMVELRRGRVEQFRVHRNLLYEKTRINEFLGGTFGTDFSVAGRLEFRQRRELYPEIVNMVDSIPALKAGEMNIRRRKAELQKNRTAFFPEISVFFTKGREIEADSWKIGAGFSIPLFNRGTHQVKAARLILDRARLNYRHQKMHLSADLKRIIATMKILEQEILSYQDSELPELEENLRLARQLYLEGESTLVDFLDIQKSYFAMKIDYYRAVAEFETLGSSLDELLGVKK